MSLVIDEIADKTKYHDTCVAYMYFDYNNSTVQTLDNVIRALLKQLLCRLDLIPHDLEGFYDDCNRYSIKPDVSALTYYLISISNHFSSVFVMLDALDECATENYADIINLIRKLRESGLKILCTSRINVPNVRCQLGQPTLVEIKAHEDDVRNYLAIRLSKEWQYDDEFKQKISDTLAEKAAGK